MKRVAWRSPGSVYGRVTGKAIIHLATDPGRTVCGIWITRPKQVLPGRICRGCLSRVHLSALDCEFLPWMKEIP